MTDDEDPLTRWEQLKVTALHSILQKGYFEFPLVTGDTFVLDYRDRLDEHEEPAGA